MGYYVNPKDGTTKEEWLKVHGQPVPASEVGSHSAGDRLLVCLVDNGWMTAAAIAYDDRERDVFRDPDGRPKQWYLVSKELLAQFMP